MLLMEHTLMEHTKGGGCLSCLNLMLKQMAAIGQIETPVPGAVARSRGVNIFTVELHLVGHFSLSFQVQFGFYHGAG